MSKENKPKDFLDKTKNQVEKVMSNVDREKLKEIDSKFSIASLKKVVTVLLVGSIIGLGVFSYWNYDHNMWDPTKVKYTNKDSRDTINRVKERWGN